MNQEALQIILSLSVHVIEIFALIFLFYTNSFLIKRRKREIGVYHILGMGKPQLAKMLVIETVVTGAVSILGGIFFGTALAKLMYALLKRMIHYDDKLASFSLESVITLRLRQKNHLRRFNFSLSQ